jgi:hypothetical protein
MIQYDVAMSSSELTGAWRPATHRLYVEIPGQPPRLRDQVAVRIRLLDRTMVATAVGSVVSLHQHGPHHRLELSPSEAGQRAVTMLLSAAGGAPVQYHQRAPRYLARLPVVVATDGGGELLMTTFSISARGCGLSWSGPPPDIGKTLRLRLGPRSRQTDVWAVVRWAGRAGQSVKAGVGLLQDAPPPAVWTELFDSTARSGAPRA